MTRTKLGLLGLCVVVFSLMAFGATGAQAESGARFLILNGKGEVKEGSTLHASISVRKDSAVLALNSEILKIKVSFLCTEIKLVNAFLQKEGTVAKEFNGEGKPVGSKVLFSGCTTDLNGVASSECTPSDPEDGKGFIVTKLGHGLAELHELAGGVKHDLILVLPDVGNTFATIGLPAGCPIGTSVPILGKVALKDCEELALAHLVEHLVAAFTPLTKLFTISETAEHATTLSGSAWGFLTGEHVGLKWSISNL